MCTLNVYYIFIFYIRSDYSEKDDLSTSLLMSTISKRPAVFTQVLFKVIIFLKNVLLNCDFEKIYK